VPEDVDTDEPDETAPVTVLLTVLTYHKYPVGAIPTDGAVQVMFQLVSELTDKTTPVAGLGIP
jgi:hypothetical protein